jgi:hypothetical protein
VLLFQGLERKEWIVKVDYVRTILLVNGEADGLQDLSAFLSKYVGSVQVVRSVDDSIDVLYFAHSGQEPDDRHFPFEEIRVLELGDKVQGLVERV